MRVPCERLVQVGFVAAQSTHFVLPLIAYILFFVSASMVHQDIAGEKCFTMHVCVWIGVQCCLKFKSGDLAVFLFSNDFTKKALTDT